MNTLFSYDPAPQNHNPVILIHGLGSDSTSWQFQIEPLINAGFRPIAIDVPGFGKSPYEHFPWTIRKASRIVLRELVDKVEEPIILVGLSMGGTIAQTLYKQRPEKIREMVLVSTFSRLRPSPGKNLPYLLRRLAQVSTGNIRKQAKTVADRLFPGTEQKFLHDYLVDQIASANPKVYRQCMVALGLFNSRSWMKKCHIPVLVISGDADSTVTLDNQVRMVQGIPGSKHIIISGGGHAVSVDHTNQFNSSLLSFIQQ